MFTCLLFKYIYCIIRTIFLTFVLIMCIYWIMILNKYYSKNNTTCCPLRSTDNKLIDIMKHCNTELCTYLTDTQYYNIIMA